MTWTPKLLDACLKHGLTVTTNHPKFLSCVDLKNYRNCPLVSDIGTCDIVRKDPALSTLIQTHRPELLI